MNDAVPRRTTAPTNLTLHDLKPKLADMREEVLAGLRAAEPCIAPKYFYDERGSELFARITALPEYYPTDAEIEILEGELGAITEVLGRGTQLVEYGSGNSHKIRVLLGGLRPRVYMPVDISADHLLDAASGIAQAHPWLDVHAVCADYSLPMTLPWRLPEAPLAGFFPGSSIGNFERAEAERFLHRVHDTLGVGGRLLIGVDRRKSADIIDPAYNDSQGITAAFNRNALNHLRSALGGNVDPDAFVHEAGYDDDAGRLQMHLVARQDVAFELGGEQFSFAAGTRIHTENSYKYAPEEFAALAHRAGFEVLAQWSDQRGLFSVFALQAA